MSEVNTFKSREDFLRFLDSIADNPYDTAPVLRNYITRLYYHNDMPVLNKVDLIDSCCRNCTVLSEADTAMYVNKLIEINFLIVTQKYPTKTLSVTDMAFENLYLNTDFYNPDRFAMGTPSVDHAGKEGKL